eukprot:403355297
MPLRNDMQQVLQKGVINIHQSVDVSKSGSINKSRNGGLLQNYKTQGNILTSGSTGNLMSYKQNSKNNFDQRKRNSMQNASQKDEKIKRCNTFIDTMTSKQAYFNYKKGQLQLPGKKIQSKQKHALDKYEAIKKLVEEKIDQHTKAALPLQQQQRIQQNINSDNNGGKKMKYSERKRMSQTQLVLQKQQKTSNKDLINDDSNSDDNSSSSQKILKHQNTLSPHLIQAAEDKQLQDLKRQMATLSLKNRQFYKQVNIDMHKAQKDKLKEMQRELVRQDKTHLKEQLNTIRRVQSQSNNSKRHKEVMAYMQSTLKEQNYGTDELQDVGGSAKQVQENMQKVFQEAKELLEKQIKEHQQVRNKQKNLEQSHSQQLILRPHSAFPQNNRKQNNSSYDAKLNKELFLKSLRDKKQKKAQKTMKQVLIMTGDLIQLEKAKEEDYEKFIGESYAKEDVVRSTPCMALHQIKRPMTGRIIKPRREKTINLVTQSDLDRNNRNINPQILSETGQQTIQNAQQIIEYAKPKYDQIIRQSKSRNDKPLIMLDSNSQNKSGLYVSVSQKKTLTQQIRESLIVSPRKMHQENLQKKQSFQKQNSSNVQQFQQSTDVSMNIGQSRPQTARIDSFLQTSRMNGSSVFQLRKSSTRGDFSRVPLLTQYMTTSNMITQHQNKKQEYINFADSSEQKHDLAVGVGIGCGGQSLMQQQQRKSANNLQKYSRNNNNHLLLFKTQAYQKYDDEYDTRYLDPKPSVNLVKVDNDLKTLMQTLSQQKSISSSSTQRMTKTILSSLTEIERANRVQIEAKQKYEEWKKSKSVSNLHKE